MALIACTAVRGGQEILTHPARVDRLKNATLVPMGHAHKPGLYGEDDALVRSAAYFRGLPEPHFPLEGESLALARSQIPAAPPGHDYVFAGHLTGHYGHFLFSVLGRLWSLDRPPPPTVRIVLLNGANAHELFEIDFARSLFEAIGLTLDHFAAFRDPVRFDDILVPEPSIEENHLGRPEFASFCHRLGEILVGDAGPAPLRPVFLSKLNLKRGVHKITNEAALCRALDRRGYDIVSPENLTFKEQISLWKAPAVCGIFGSMLHTSIFTPRARYVALNPEVWINSNQVILDRLNGAKSRILFPSAGYLPEPAAGFDHGLRLQDPEGVARGLHREATRLRDGDDGAGRLIPRPLRRLFTR